MAVNDLETRRPAVHVGKVVRAARLFNFRNPRGGTMSDSALLDAAERLFALLADRRADYLLVGGIALLQYVDGRNTEDVDLILSPASLERLPELRETGRQGDFVRADFQGLQIDVLLTSNRLFDEVRRRHATRRPFVEREIPCATPAGLALLKLYALPSLYRQGNAVRAALYETDVLMLMQAHGIDPAPLLAELAPHLPAGDLEAVRQIVDEIRARIDRAGSRFV